MKNNDKHDTIVISGISGQFPECENIDKFRDALLQGVDLLCDDDRRYNSGLFGTPRRVGKLPCIDKFDSSYFGVHPKQATFMDPRQRLLMEAVYESIIDAGYNPKELKGTKTGVYVGISSFSCVAELRKEETFGYTNIGLSLAMAANRASYCFDLKGPSYSVDSACSSSMIAFVNAIKDIKSGETDAAFVCGSHLINDPFESSEFHLLNMLSPEGKCKVFSTERNGYARAETVVSCFLQREKDSRRIYATVLGAKVNTDGHKVEGITVPSSEVQLQLMKELYIEVNVDPKDVVFIEAHGTGTTIGDIQECKALAKMFGEGRKEPLLIGAVKSNMGHAETASGMCSLTKVLLSMESGIIPANLHACPIDYDIPGIKENKLKVVVENTPWEVGITGMNSFGFGGANAHVILQPNLKTKKPYKRPKNRLVQVSGRTAEAVTFFLDELQANQDDAECLALVDEIHKINMDGHNFRGYAVLGDTVTTELDRFSKERPIFFVYTGMGCQWEGMGRDLMGIEVFRNSIQKCAVALQPYGVDLIDIITNPSATTFDNITNCFSAIGACEIALTDVLFSLGIVPDGIAGHSLGEVGCSYADGQITQEQAVLLAFSRGYASQNTKIPPGQMAAIGLSKEEVLKILPENIYVACQNSKNSITISGEAKATKAFVEKLTEQGVFAKLVKSAGIAFHTKYITEAGDLLLDFCKKVLPHPKPRSSKWISSSVPAHKVDEKWAKYNCAEYHHNNFCNAVLFDQVYEHIPENAIVVEVAPHGLLQAILKRELGPENTYISIANRSSDDNERFFLSSVGKIYVAGGQPNLRNLYNNVQFPVSRGTKTLSPMVKWDHSITWYVPGWKNHEAFGEVFTVDTSDERWSYLEGHLIDGRVLMPATGYLHLIWKLLATRHIKEQNELPIVLEKIKFKRATVLPHGEPVKFLVNFMKQSGYFEIFEGGSIVVTGTIRMPKDISSEFSHTEPPAIPQSNYLKMSREDLYKECHLRRYEYKGLFQGAVECDVFGVHGKLEWKGNFVSFLDTMIHLNLGSQIDRDLSLPTSIEKIIIDPVKHLKLVEEQKEIEAFNNQDLNIIRSGAVEIIGLESSKAPRRQITQTQPYLETCDFVYYESTVDSEHIGDTALRIALQIVLQNVPGVVKEIKICELTAGGAPSEGLSAKVKEIYENQALVDFEVTTCQLDKLASKSDLIVLTSKVPVDFETLLQYLTEDGFVLYKGNSSRLQNSTLQIIYQADSGENTLFLLRRQYDFPKNYAVVNVRNTDFDWLEKLKALVEKEEPKVVYLFSQGEDTSGIIGLTKCLIAEPSLVAYKAIFVDQETDTFSIDDEFYREQLKKNLTINILKGNNWGTIVHLPMAEVEKKEVGNAATTVLTIGDLSSLTWVQRPVTSIKIHENSELVSVFYCALNFKDVMLATGKLQMSQGLIPTAPEINIGLEYAGVTPSGKRVMGLLGWEALSLQVQTDPDFLWDVPNSWTLRDAATVPCVYATCYYALIIRGQMQPGESILIHAGTGGIGMAAISIALNMGCQVFTTVGSKEKREYIKKIFPQLEDRNIGNSRDTSFENMVMGNTKKKGVDLVLNSLSAELFQASLRCVARRGRFLEIGKVDFFSGTPIDSRMFLKNCSFHGIFLDDLFDSNCSVKMEIQNLLREGIVKGVVKPLPNTLFNENEVEEAFRFLSSGKHKGKVVIEVRKENSVTLKSPARTIMAIPKVYFDPKKSYILIGGLGGFGLELADWLIKRGATKIILNSRRNVSNGYQCFCLRKWAQYKGISVEISTDDTSTLEGATKLITKAEKLGPVGGVFNMALVLKDALLSNQTKSNFEDVFRAKIVSGQNMDVVTRKHCKELDHFVVFSSVACGRGNSGQTNYGMANSALERLCERRRQANLPGMAIQWGPVGDVGALANLDVQDKIFEHMVPQNITSCLTALEKFMVQSTVVGSSLVLADKSGTTSVRGTRSPAEAVAHILGIKNIELVDKSLTLSQLGLDSLMMAEIKQTLYRNYQLELGTNEIRELTLQDLIALGEEEDDIATLPVSNEETEKILAPQSLLIAKEEILEMNVSKSSKKNIFLFHPIEGHVGMLKPLAKGVKANVYGIQCTKDNDSDTMQKFASRYIERIRKIQPQGPYFFCGYSYGGVVSLEMGLQLEKVGETVHIVSIEGSSYFVKQTLGPTFVRLGSSIEKSKVAVLTSFCSSFPEVDQDKVNELLRDSQSYEAKLQVTSEFISNATGIDKDEISESAKKFYNRCSAIFFYEPESIFKGRLLLIRTAENPFISSEDYEIQKECQQTVTIVKLKGSHSSIVLGENATKISDIINDFFTL